MKEETFQMYDPSIIRKVKELISAARIQNTWRSVQISRKSEGERGLAKMNMKEILLDLGASWYNSGMKLKTRPDIIDNLSKLPIIKKGTAIRFDKDILDVDGKDQSKHILVHIINNWLYYTKDKGNFFNDVSIQKLLKPDHTENLIQYINEIICVLKDGKSMYLWGELGQFKKIYPTQLNNINSLLVHLHLYLIKLEITNLKSELQYGDMGNYVLVSG